MRTANIKFIAMNTITMKKSLMGILVFLFGLGTIYGQTTDATSVNVTQANASGEIIKVIDNKGTIKYLQSNNGITTITSTTAVNTTTTTWQLGGALTDDTYIDVDGNVFGFDGIALETGAASTDAVTESDRGTGTGWTLLVRDEATGAVRKLLATDLIQSGLVTDTVDAAEETAGSIVVATPGLSNTIQQIWVYRNGAKLLAATDFTIDTTTGGSETVTVANVGAGAGAFSLLNGDLIEVQWVK